MRYQIRRLQRISGISELFHLQRGRLASWLTDPLAGDARTGDTLLKSIPGNARLPRNAH